MTEILDVIHNTIYQFFDVCGDDEEEAPMSDKDKLLLEVNKAICNNLKALEQEPKWIPVSEKLPMLNEEAYSDEVLVQLKNARFEISISEGAGIVHITKIARYDESAISSDGICMDTEGWMLEDGSTLSMDEVIAWMPLPQPLKEENTYIVTDEYKRVINQRYSPVDFCTYGECPTCGEIVSGFSIGSPNLYDKECPKCGQKLKWR